MAVLYVNYQDNRKGGNKLFYGRAVHPTTVDLDYIADRIQHNCSMTKGDTLSVLTELVSVMKDELQNSNKVKLDGFGTFYLAMKTKGAVTEEDFDVIHNVKGVRVGFLAEGSKQNGVIVRTFTDDIEYKKISLTSASTSGSTSSAND